MIFLKIIFYYSMQVKVHQVLTELIEIFGEDQSDI